MRFSVATNTKQLKLQIQQLKLQIQSKQSIVPTSKKRLHVTFRTPRSLYSTYKTKSKENFYVPPRLFVVLRCEALLDSPVTDGTQERKHFVVKPEMAVFTLQL